VGPHREPNSATELLERGGVDPADIHRRVEARLTLGASSQAAERIPWTPYSRKAIALAEARSAERGAVHIDCDDLLVGLARVGRSVAATVLTEAGFEVPAPDRTADRDQQP
jgi:ATP-dependent Clp protease ATP-binding subunit ClpA